MYRRGIEFVAEGAADHDRTPESHSESSKENTESVVDFYRNLVLTSASELNKHKSNESTGQSSSGTADQLDNELWCRVCQVALSRESVERHQQSIGHLASRSDYPDIPDPIVLNETNIGYRMLQRAGWDDNQGLGVELQGRRHPIKARMRPRQLGLGAKERPSSAPSDLEIGSNISQAAIARKAEVDRVERLELLAYLKR
ncbi:hypothetical protein BDF22DRAFT_250046 [Syncephalis plumigaleata]|nr:hypothetical protein BDF22DRAFT_250046 [Syncephalis plumigaleata]